MSPPSSPLKRKFSSSDDDGSSPNPNPNSSSSNLTNNQSTNDGGSPPKRMRVEGSIPTELTFQPIPTPPAGPSTITDDDSDDEADEEEVIFQIVPREDKGKRREITEEEAKELREKIARLEEEAHLHRAALSRANVIVKCTVCCSPIRNPQVMECGHTGCYRCLRRWWTMPKPGDERFGHGDDISTDGDSDSDDDDKEYDEEPKEKTSEAEPKQHPTPSEPGPSSSSSSSSTHRPHHYPHRPRLHFRPVTHRLKTCPECQHTLHRRPVPDFRLRHTIDALRLNPLSPAALARRDERWSTRTRPDIWHGIFPADRRDEEEEEAVVHPHWRGEVELGQMIDEDPILRHWRDAQARRREEEEERRRREEMRPPSPPIHVAEYFAARLGLPGAAPVAPVAPVAPALTFGRPLFESPQVIRRPIPRPAIPLPLPLPPPPPPIHPPLWQPLDQHGIPVRVPVRERERAPSPPEVFRMGLRSPEVLPPPVNIFLNPPPSQPQPQLQPQLQTQPQPQPEAGPSNSNTALRPTQPTQPAAAPSSVSTSISASMSTPTSSYQPLIDINPPSSTTPPGNTPTILESIRHLRTQYATCSSSSSLNPTPASTSSSTSTSTSLPSPTNPTPNPPSPHHHSRSPSSDIPDPDTLDDLIDFEAEADLPLFQAMFAPTPAPAPPQPTHAEPEPAREYPVYLEELDFDFLMDIEVDQSRNQTHAQNQVEEDGVIKFENNDENEDGVMPLFGGVFSTWEEYGGLLEGE